MCRTSPTHAPIRAAVLHCSSAQYRTALENIWALSVQSVQAVVVSLSPVVAKIAVEWGDLYIAGDVIATVEV